MKKSKNSLFLTRAAMIGAIYVILTMLSSLMGLSSGVIQLRLSEAMCLLPLIFPEAIAGLTIGCAISNIIFGGAFFDVILGALATLVGALGTYFLRRLPKKLLPLAALPPILSNAIIIPFVLMLAYGVDEGYFFLFISIFIGESLSAGVGGVMLYNKLKNVL